MTQQPGSDRAARHFTVPVASIKRCPIASLSSAHYNDDGTCRHHPGDTTQCRVCERLIRFDPTTSSPDRWVHMRTGRTACGIRRTVDDVRRHTAIPAEREQT